MSVHQYGLGVKKRVLKLVKQRIWFLAFLPFEKKRFTINIRVPCRFIGHVQWLDAIALHPDKKRLVNT